MESSDALEWFLENCISYQCAGRPSQVSSFNVCQAICDNVYGLNLDKASMQLIFTGSAPEGMAEEARSDVDVMSVRRDFPEVLIENGSLSQPSAGVFIKGNPKQPAYLRLLVPANAEQDNITKWWAVQDGNETWLSSERFVQFSKDPNNHTIQGPALKGLLNVDISDKDTMDLVFCLRSTAWPPCAREYLTRSRRSKNPSQEQIRNIKAAGCHVVGTGHPQTESRNLEWRWSFSVAERNIIQGMDQTMAEAMYELKILLKTTKLSDDSNNDKPICSYHLKTAFLWMNEDRLPTENKSSIALVKQAIGWLKTCYEVQTMKHYFISDQNLIGHIPKQTCQDVSTILSEIEDELQLFVFRSLEKTVRTKEMAWPYYGILEAFSEVKRLIAFKTQSENADTVGREFISALLKNAKYRLFLGEAFRKIHTHCVLCSKQMLKRYGMLDQFGDIFFLLEDSLASRSYSELITIPEKVLLPVIDKLDSIVRPVFVDKFSSTLYGKLSLAYAELSNLIKENPSLEDRPSSSDNELYLEELCLKKAEEYLPKDPNKPENLTLESVSDQNASVTWTSPLFGRWDKYEITIASDGGNQSRMFLEQASTTHKFGGLNAATKYTITLKALLFGASSEDQLIDFFTMPSKPGNLRRESVSEQTISISWTSPTYGSWDKYEATITPEGGTESSVVLSKDSTTHQFTGLAAATKYTIKMKTVASGVSSKERTIKVWTESPPEKHQSGRAAKNAGVLCSMSTGGILMTENPANKSNDSIERVTKVSELRAMFENRSDLDSGPKRNRSCQRVYDFPPSPRDPIQGSPLTDRGKRAHLDSGPQDDHAGQNVLEFPQSSCDQIEASPLMDRGPVNLASDSKEGVDLSKCPRSGDFPAQPKSSADEGAGDQNTEAGDCDLLTNDRRDQSVETGQGEPPFNPVHQDHDTCTLAQLHPGSDSLPYPPSEPESSPDDANSHFDESCIISVVNTPSLLSEERHKPTGKNNCHPVTSCSNPQAPCLPKTEPPIIDTRTSSPDQTTESHQMVPPDTKNLDSSYVYHTLGLEPNVCLNLTDVMAINSCDTCNIRTASPLQNSISILRQLIMLDFSARDNYHSLNKPTKRGDDNVSNEHIQSKSRQVLHQYAGTAKQERESEGGLNPMDVFLALFLCSDQPLQQLLLGKMFLCRLAVPFIFLDNRDGGISLYLWALRGIVAEWNDNNRGQEKAIVEHPICMVSIIRVGKCSFSKSHLANRLLSNDEHPTFFHKGCPQGCSRRRLANGLVETAFSLPSGKQSDFFSDVLMFCNLRGDSMEFPAIINMLGSLSAYILVCMDLNTFVGPESARWIKGLQDSDAFVNILVENPTKNIVDKQVVHDSIEAVFNAFGEERANISLPRHGQDVVINAGCIASLRESIRDTTKTAKKHALCNINEILPIKQYCYDLDEFIPFCKETKEMCLEFINMLPAEATSECKTHFLPLQGELWQELSRAKRDVHRTARKTEDFLAKKYDDMNLQRTKQYRKFNEQSPNYIKQVLDQFLLCNKDQKKNTMLLTWYQLLLDSHSMRLLPDLHDRYSRYWRTSNDDQRLRKLEDLLENASFGLQHLIREVGQVYEAHKEAPQLSKAESMDRMPIESRLFSTCPWIDELPNVGAQILLQGFPLEIMNGDGSSPNVPITWVKAALHALQCILGRKKVLVLSVLGVESSGKSTFLNAMFGLQLATSAGRCTRGVNFQLVKVAPDAGLPFEYVVVADTEGIGSPGATQDRLSHDNELATLVIGLSDVTIINIKGESNSEIKDVIQIAVHAFIRMKAANKTIKLKHRCLFVHQNVPATNAKEKLIIERKQLSETLNSMAQEAAKVENVADVSTFSDVIKFDGRKDVWYFPDSWYGNPPMAHVNPEYHRMVKEVKTYIFTDNAKVACPIDIQTLSSQIELLWNSILSDNFVFCFRNSLQLKSFSELEQCYNEAIVEMKVSISILERHTETQMRKAKLEIITTLFEKSMETIPTFVEERAKEAEKKINEFIDSHPNSHILDQWRKFKLERIELLSQTHLTNFKERLFKAKTNCERKFCSNEKIMKYKSLITDRMIQLANEMRGKPAGQQTSRFEKLWNGLIVDITMETSEAKDIRTEVIDNFYEIIPTRICHSVEQKKLDNCESSDPDSMPSKMVDYITGDNNENFIEDHIDISWSIDTQEDKEHYRAIVTNLTLMLFSEIDAYFNNLSQRKTCFRGEFIAEVFSLLPPRFSKFNERLCDHLQLTPQYEAKIYICILNYSVREFTKLDEEYNREYGFIIKLTQFKQTAWTLFQNVLQKKRKEKIAADLFCEQLSELILEAVLNQINEKIVTELAARFKSKTDLMIAMSTSIAESDIFKNVMEYLVNPKAFAMSYLTDIVESILFGSTERQIWLTRLFRLRRRNPLLKFVEDSVANISGNVKLSLPSIKRKTTYMQDWMADLKKELVNTLPKTHTLFFHSLYDDAMDASKFKEHVKEQMRSIERQTLQQIKSLGSLHQLWEGEAPHKTMLDNLWGCEALCPFCSEPCVNNDPDHIKWNTKHKCIIHRPQELTGKRFGNEMNHQLNTCYFRVATKATFKCKPSLYLCKNCLTPPSETIEHSFSEYERYAPDWIIERFLSPSEFCYWQYIMGHFRESFVELYGLNNTEMPRSWSKLTKEDAIESLELIRNKDCIHGMNTWL